MIYLTSCFPPCEIFGEPGRPAPVLRPIIKPSIIVSIIAESVTLESQVPPPPLFPAFPTHFQIEFPDRISRNSPQTRRTLTRGAFHLAKGKKGREEEKKIGGRRRRRRRRRGNSRLRSSRETFGPPQPASDRTVLIPPPELPQALPAGLRPPPPPLPPPRLLPASSTRVENQWYVDF